MHFDHIGLVVKNISYGIEHFESSIGIKRISPLFKDEGIGVSVQFVEDFSNVCYELIAPLNEDSPVCEALRTGARIINHVAYRVFDLTAARNNILRGGAVAVTPPQPAVAYNGKNVQFFVTRLRFIVEFIETEEAQQRDIIFSNYTPSCEVGTTGL